MKHEVLFEEYQRNLEWINRRLQPSTLDFYHETADAWKHAKEVAFDMYQQLRKYTIGGIPKEADCIRYLKNENKKYPDYVPDGAEQGFPCIGILKYRDREFPIYSDDYGMQDFVVVEGKHVTVDSFGGGYDWYYEIDRILDNISD